MRITPSSPFDSRQSRTQGTEVANNWERHATNLAPGASQQLNKLPFLFSSNVCVLVVHWM